MNPVFKSRENTRYIVDGKEVWEHRANAVGAVILGIHKNNIFVLAEKRSNHMPDGKGLWVVPSGYINYDEDGWDAMRRECWEETGFSIYKYRKYIVFDNDQDSWYTHTKPTENRQNIVIWYCIIYDFSYRDLPREVESYKDHEIDEVKWIPIEQVLTPIYKWAFGHDERIEQAVLKFKNYLK